MHAIVIHTQVSWYNACDGSRLTGQFGVMHAMVIHSQVCWCNSCYGNPLTGLLVLCMWWESTHRWGGAMHALVIHLRSVCAMHTCICNPHTGVCNPHKGHLVKWHVFVIHTQVSWRKLTGTSVLQIPHAGELSQYIAGTLPVLWNPHTGQLVLCIAGTLLLLWNPHTGELLQHIAGVTSTADSTNTWLRQNSMRFLKAADYLLLQRLWQKWHEYNDYYCLSVANAGCTSFWSGVYSYYCVPMALQAVCCWSKGNDY